MTKGGGDWARWKRDLQRILGEQGGDDVRVTTLFDLNGLPRGFPGLDADGAEQDSNRRCDRLQEALATSIGDRRLIPYLQRHEFEALVLGSLPSLRKLLDADDDLEGLNGLEREIANLRPEDIDDGPHSASSKRLLAHIPGYRKAVHGPLATEDTGLAALRSQCERFDAWVALLEGLST